MHFRYRRAGGRLQRDSGSVTLHTTAAWDNIAWSRAFFTALEPFLTGGVYVNDLGNEGGDRVRAAYGTNYARLVEVKDRYDPTNLFRINHNVGPTRPGSP